MKITEFGKELRKLRIDCQERLLDMADRLETSVSQLSSIETGRRKIPQGFPEKLIELYGLTGDRAQVLLKKSQEERSIWKIEAKNGRQRELAAMLSRRMNDLSDYEIDEINKIIERHKVNYAK